MMRKKLTVMTIVVMLLVGVSNIMAVEEDSKQLGSTDSTLISESKCKTLKNAESDLQTNGKWDGIMKAIIAVESRGNARAFNPRGNCAGILQITPGMVRACNEICKSKKLTKRFTLQDRFNPQKSREMFVMFQEKHNPQRNVERAIRMWNGGPGYKKKSTERYYRKVMQHYK